MLGWIKVVSSRSPYYTEIIEGIVPVAYRRREKMYMENPRRLTLGNDRFCSAGTDFVPVSFEVGRLPKHVRDEQAHVD